MFICRPCCDASGLWERLAKSRGICEVCGHVDVCDDWPVGQMPPAVILTSGCDD